MAGFYLCDAPLLQMIGLYVQHRLQQKVLATQSNRVRGKSSSTRVLFPEHEVKTSDPLSFYLLPKLSYLLPVKLSQHSGLAFFDANMIEKATYCDENIQSFFSNNCNNSAR